jgi:GNAT superfamily N-acetyltransferase
MINQRTLSLTFREFRSSDYDRLIEIYNANYPDYTTSVAEQRARDESIDTTKYLHRRFTCLDPSSGDIVGFGQISHVLDMFHPQKYTVRIWVDPARHRTGIGGAIYDRLIQESKELGAIVLWTTNIEDLPHHREFLERRGFRARSRAWESRLDLTSFDPTPFQEYLRRAESAGVSFHTLQDVLGSDRKSLREIHQLVQDVVADMPSVASSTPVPYDQWEKLELNSPTLLPEGYVTAKRGSEYVGLSIVYSIEKEPRNLSQGDTGVRRAYRGRGIATALKLKAIDFGKRNRYEKLKTWNDSTNAAMLAINTKLGFKRQVGWITMEKTLGVESPV